MQQLTPWQIAAHTLDIPIEEVHCEETNIDKVLGCYGT